MSSRIQSPSRREFVNMLTATTGALVLSSPGSASSVKRKSRPNILWIMSDEHNPAITGRYGNTLAQMPNIDSLAEQGVAFETHYCNSPLCTPSRLSLTAGKYVSRVDAWA